MGKREATAFEVLAAGGYFRRALERTYMGGEKFATRLYTATGGVVPGVGRAVQEKLWAEGKLATRECARSSTWPTEWVLKGGA